jgi:ribosomal protein S17E
LALEKAQIVLVSEERELATVRQFKSLKSKNYNTNKLYLHLLTDNSAKEVENKISA